MSARIFAIIAREARKAVVFRRGPSKRVLLCTWDLASDTIEEGQWLKGRIYERRCDLSPDGSLLVYFGGNQKPPYGTWTAVSRPPYLTALALWPVGHTWNGGGLFASNRELLLNHLGEPELAEGFKLPKWLRVGKLMVRRGEDAPIWYARLERDGWRKVEEGVFDRANPRAPRSTLRMTIYGVGEKNGPWYTIEYSVLDEHERSRIDLGPTDWADWDHNGELLSARDGKLFREETVVADLNALAFAERVSPQNARSWPRGRGN